MTTEEACAHLNIADAADAADGFETVLFETKQFLLSKPVFLKTFQGRLAKLAKQREALLLLGGEELPEILPETPAFVPSENVLNHLLAYYAAKNPLRKALSAAESYPVVTDLVARMLELERQFAEPFAHFPDWTDAPVTIGKEPDVMDVLALLKEQAASGLETLAELHRMKNNLPAELLLVLKRLSLLKNYLYE